MINPRYSEDEQAERLKEWWKKNGTSVIVGAVIGVGTIVGVNFWRDYTQNQAEAASARYEQLLSTTGEEARALGSELVDQYSSTPYAELAALYVAKTSYEEGDADNAESMLKWTMDNARQTASRHTARLRLARLYLDSERVSAAADLARVEQYDGFESEYKELIGDIALLQGDPGGATAAYEDALSALPEGSRYSELLVLKLDHASGKSAQ